MGPSSQTNVANVRKRTIYQLDTPFSTVSWPDISLEDQESILELLCSLLSSLGQHRRDHVKPSKGKRVAKREKVTADQKDLAKDQPIPQAPELGLKVDIGFNVITRNLEGISRGESGHTENADGDVDLQTNETVYSMVFVARGDQSSAFNCQFPRMVAAATKELPPDSQTRLVGFSKSCSERLSKSLHIPRVSSIAIKRDAPGCKALWDFVREKVPPVDAAWLGKPQDQTSYFPTRINSIETTVGQKKARKT
ncbi:unnamed protein product [Clonostachys rhizophaga]|uniref:Uncharacterized protein n=1 Tax=Clonostachys rhizophaga TaxID=160324 RepID=A0A9N9VAJ5_9HYPO|nr:unnamed protein product [Clonostachys rhizophaga]